jgi:hypothetical protein
MYVSSGPVVSDIYVPDVVGHTEEDALILLDMLAVTVQPIDSKEPAGTVVEQSIVPYDPEGKAVTVRVGAPIVIRVSTGNSPETSVNIVFAVPAGITKSASATFRTYINGNLKDEADVDNIKYSTTVTVPVRGTGIQRVTLEGVNNDTRKLINIGEYEVNFDTGETRELEFNTRNFLTLFEGTASVQTTPSYYDPYGNDPYAEDPNAGDEFWEHVIIN